MFREIWKRNNTQYINVNEKMKKQKILELKSTTKKTKRLDVRGIWKTEVFPSLEEKIFKSEVRTSQIETFRKFSELPHNKHKNQRIIRTKLLEAENENELK